ncbi:LytR C-terminal domain-containing protein [Nocardioides speluncae]|uniref:LytR C-terminal domain-containing protein n=1 Tax=Nocardioides speluncae TaxID=2670337 RepID=UPI00137B040E|nr:LytR C-terminal domain-containing protein [Nocardioides speluncae]
MGPQVKSALTLTVLGVILVVFLVWGWNAATAPLPGLGGDSSAEEEGPVCEPRAVKKGERIRTVDVTVSILNATAQDGLAAKTMRQFTGRGFGDGELGNAPTEHDVLGVAIVTDDPSSPAVRLVASYLGDKPRIIQSPPTALGVVVVIGEDFERLRRGASAVTVREDTTICSPLSS